MKPPLKIIVKPDVTTDRVGGVDIPSAETLKSMHQSRYILRAAEGKLTKVPAEKTLLPHSDDMSPQRAQVDIGPDGTIYVRQSQILCKSSDAGHTWRSTPIDPKVATGLGEKWKVLRDGTFICVFMAAGAGPREPAFVRASQDEGQTWTDRARIPIEMDVPTNDKPYTMRFCDMDLNRWGNDTLLWGFTVRNVDGTTETKTLFCFRSTDGGHTWQGPIRMIDYGSEGAQTLLRSGRVFGTVRYQRPELPGDTQETLAHIRTPQVPDRDPPRAFKNCFVTDSDDGGLTWSPPRMLTTVHGQPFGAPAAQSDGTVVVIHDTRYGPGHPGSRAMISRNEGRTWLDEVYYLDTTEFTGSYSASLVLDDDTILSICGSSQAGNDWDAVKAATDLYAIRWKPVKA